jgi:hypothetical protein
MDIIKIGIKTLLHTETKHKEKKTSGKKKTKEKKLKPKQNRKDPK